MCSATIVAAYLMKKHKMSTADALKYVKYKHALLISQTVVLFHNYKSQGLIRCMHCQY
ncbi:unnamed protein product [Rhodiola kirilowii]